MRTLGFRLFFLLLVLTISVSTLIVSGTAIFFYREDRIIENQKQIAKNEILELGKQIESYLGVVEQSMMWLTEASLNMEPEKFSEILDRYIVAQPLIRALYIIDETGKTIAVGTPDERPALHPDFLGLDFSYNPIFNGIKKDYRIIWSDKFISTLSGDTSVSAAVKIAGRTAIAELPFESLLNALGVISNTTDRVWIVDRRGELVADTGNREEGAIRNVLTIPFMGRAMKGEKLDTTVSYEDESYYVTYNVSDKLGWLFLIGVPTGMNNPLVYHTLLDILLISGSFIVIAIAIIPFWSLKVSRDIEQLRRQADTIANGQEPDISRKNAVTEFKELSQYMQAMYLKIKKREEDLKSLNQMLEQRVDQRTKELKQSNTELQSTLDNLSRMQNALVQTEKHAALGRLVAGVAHELNTPIGNAVMALSSMKDEQRRFQERITAGLRKSDLDDFTSHVRQGLEIAERNSQRAAELIKSFKHVANDQSSSKRRSFDLTSIVEDVLLTLRPTIKRTPHKIEFTPVEGIVLDSFPGVLGQILTNLVTNALVHAWDEGDAGTIIILAHLISPSEEGEKNSWVDIRVQDDGKGIPEDFAQKIFDPFFTTKMGSGGTGLGLNIAHNSTTQILGGSIDYTCPPSGGTCFSLQIPLVAPKID